MSFACLRPVLGALALITAPTAVHADTPSTTEKGGPAIWPPYGKIAAVLRHWDEQAHPNYTLEALGESVEGRTVYAVTMTDPEVPIADKEHALVTALHAGIERGAATTVMSIIEWFLSGDPLAAEILRNQVVVFLPLPDPDRYEKGEFTPIYGSWNEDGPLNPDKVPEAVYVQQVFERFQPDVHADIHGVSLDFEKYIMFECSATSYSNPALRPFHREIIRQMDAAALDAGFPSDTGEADAERIFGGPGLANIERRTWSGRPRYYAATYLYHHFHTLIGATEVAWERSGLVRHQRLMEIGNERWPGYYHKGYPNRVIMGNTHAQLVAYGPTAAARRASRIALWNGMDGFTFGTLDPAMEGQASAFLATSAEAEHYLEDKTLDEVLARLEKHPRMNHAAVRAFFQGWPAGQNGPTPQLHVTRRVAESTRPDALKQGASIKLRLPYPKATITELKLNGEPITESETDGFVSWVARGCRYIQVNLPPERLAAEDLFVVTCAYAPGEEREHWDTWQSLP